jgi:ornithine cyclodeaminase/alanine dehydrogenase-like protein (mu-crystallin family)
MIPSQKVSPWETSGPELRDSLFVSPRRLAIDKEQQCVRKPPALERISIWARRPEQAKALIASLKDVGTELTVAADLKTAAQTTDIVSTATMSRNIRISAPPLSFSSMTHHTNPGVEGPLSDPCGNRRQRRANGMVWERLRLG